MFNGQVFLLTCFLTDRRKTRAPTWNYCFLKFWQVGSNVKWLAPLTVRSPSQQPPKRSVLSHAASAWWGFTTADDRQRLEAVIRRCICSGFCSADQSPLSELVEAADDHLKNILCNKEHDLNSVLASNIQLIYELRTGRHNRSRVTEVNTMNECDFVFILLYD